MSETVVIVASFAESLRLFRFHLIRDLVQRGCRVVALAPSPSTEVRAALAEIGAEVRSIPMARRSLSPLDDAKTLVALIRQFSALRPDVILAYTIKPILYASLAARTVRSARVYAMVEGLGYSFAPTEGAGGKLKAVIRRALKFAIRTNSGMIFLNEDDRAEFRRRSLLPDGMQNMVVAGTGIDLKFFAPVALPAEPVFLMVSRLLKSKGVPEYLEAARQLRSKGYDARFVLIGWPEQGPDAVSRTEVDACVREGTVEYRQPVDDIRPVLAAARFFVLPSHREGLSRTIMEAMAMGRPVITTDVPGCRQLVNTGVNGVLVEPRAPEALADAMEALLENPQVVEQYGAAGRSRAEVEFDVRVVNQQLLRFMNISQAHREPVVSKVVERG